MILNRHHIIHCILKWSATVALLAIVGACSHDSDDNTPVTSTGLSLVVPLHMSQRTPTRAVVDPDDLPTDPGKLYEGLVSRLRAYCFRSDGSGLDKQQVRDVSALEQTQGKYEMVLEVPPGRKNLAIVANEPAALNGVLDGTSTLVALKGMQVDLAEINSLGNKASLPMYSLADVAVTTNNQTKIESKLTRSVAKVELLIKKSQEFENLGWRAYIKAARGIRLSNAPVTTSYIDRTAGTPTYGELYLPLTEDVEITTQTKLVFATYIGDHRSADVSRLNLTLEIELRQADGTVISTSERKICVGDSKQLPGADNTHIHRNVIYRIEGEVSRYGNIKAQVIDWETMKILDVQFGGFSQQITVFDWATLDYDSILKHHEDDIDDRPGNNAGLITEPWGNVNVGNGVLDGPK